MKALRWIFRGAASTLAVSALIVVSLAGCSTAPINSGQVQAEECATATAGIRAAVYLRAQGKLSQAEQDSVTAAIGPVTDVCIKGKPLVAGSAQQVAFDAAITLLEGLANQPVKK